MRNWGIINVKKTPRKYVAYTFWKSVFFLDSNRPICWKVKMVSVFTWKIAIVWLVVLVANISLEETNKVFKNQKFEQIRKANAFYMLLSTTICVSTLHILGRCQHLTSISSLRKSSCSLSSWKRFEMSNFCSVFIPLFFNLQTNHFVRGVHAAKRFWETRESTRQ